MRPYSLPRLRAIDCPKEVLPVPGAPTKHKIGATPSRLRLRIEIKSKMRSFISFNPK